MNKKQKVFRIEEDTWEEFKRLAALNNSDSSKELRMMIEKYVQHYRAIDTKNKYSNLSEFVVKEGDEIKSVEVVNEEEILFPKIVQHSDS